MGIRIIAILICFLPPGIVARPVSYSGGSTVMVFSDNMKDSIYYHYSPSYRYSLGFESVKDKYFKKDHVYFRYTRLLDRKNTEKSQRNLYFQSGISTEGLDNHFYGIQGDWESRRWFAAFGYKKVVIDEQYYTDQFYQTGLAPYLGEYGDLHTWFLFKIRKHSLAGGWSTYPVLKFFKGNFLIEFGYNSETEWDAHLMYRF